MKTNIGFSLIAVVLLTLTLPAFSQNCLPNFEITKSEKKCGADADCVLVGDACRSCGPAYVANVKFKNSIERRDLKARAAVNCLLTCEACDRNRVLPKCESGECTAAAAD